MTGDLAVAQHLEATDEFYVSSIVIGELFYGAFNSTNVNNNLDRIEAFVRDAVALPWDNATARIYGEIKTLLREKGCPIPENDIWIAATARQYSLSLVTRDDHFVEVDDLPMVRW